MSLYINNASEGEMPGYFLQLIDKLERCLDFESDQPPAWVQIYGKNKTMYAVDLESWINRSAKDADTQLNHVLSVLCCNQNVTAVGYVFPGMKVDIPKGTDEDMVNDEDKLYRLAKNDNAENVSMIMLAGYETRETVYQAFATCHFAIDKEFGESSLSPWEYGRWSADELREAGQDAYCGLRGFFVAAEDVQKHLSGEEA